MSGLFVTVEGGDGAGKTTQIARLAAALRGFGHTVVTTREPGGTEVAERIRAVLLDPTLSPTPMTDTLLHFAARADHVATVIRPALDRGDIVLCDRFTDSTRAYQGMGQGFPLDVIETLAFLIATEPDVTIVLDIPVATSLSRAAARPGGLDRYERLGPNFLERVRAGFGDIARGNPERCTLIDADRPIEAVAADILAAITGRLHAQTPSIAPQPSAATPA